MGNLHLLPTDKSSKLYKILDFNILDIIQNPPYIMENGWLGNNVMNQHIYITSDEEIKEGDWCICLENIFKNEIFKVDSDTPNKSSNVTLEFAKKYLTKIILTTDQDLIKDGVQAIDDEFLEWFVKNPNCEEVEVKKECCGQCDERLCEVYDREIGWTKTNTFYKIIIPKENQETVEEAAENEFPLINTKFDRRGVIEAENLNLLGHRRSFIKGAKWQAERMYSEGDVKDFISDWTRSKDGLNINLPLDKFEEWFEKNKKK